MCYANGRGAFGGAPVPASLFFHARPLWGERAGEGGKREAAESVQLRSAHALSGRRARIARGRRCRRRGRQMRVQQVHHQIDDHARHRHVHPDRPRPTRDSTMPCEAAAQRAAERDQGERHDHYREHDVRGEDAEIHGPDQTLAAETHVADVVVVNAVRDEESHRHGECADHARAMDMHLMAANRDISRHQQNRCRRVQDRVERRERSVGR